MIRAALIGGPKLDSLDLIGSKMDVMVSIVQKLIEIGN